MTVARIRLPIMLGIQVIAIFFFVVVEIRSGTGFGSKKLLMKITYDNTHPGGTIFTLVRCELLAVLPEIWVTSGQFKTLLGHFYFQIIEVITDNKPVRVEEKKSFTPD